MLSENAVTGMCALVEALTGGLLPATGNRQKPCQLLKKWGYIHEQIISGWKIAAFSDRPDASLHRYFSFQLEVIRQLSDNLFELQSDLPAESCYAALRDRVLASLDYLLQFFPRYIDQAATAPLAYKQRFLGELKPRSERLYTLIGQTDPEDPFQKPIKMYLVEMIDGGNSRRYTFQELFYFRNFIGALLTDYDAPAKKTVDFLGRLITVNFNHLQVFTVATTLWHDDLSAFKTLAGKLAHLFALKTGRRPVPVNAIAYSAAWPSLAVMLSEWLDEEIAATAAYAQLSASKGEIAEPGKLTLDLSVAHLAAIIRLMVKEEILKTASLADIFRFAATHLRTRRQEMISPGSLSKEYYSVSQVTAATILDKLTKMAGRINRDFFPVFLAAGLIVRDFLKNC